MVGWRPVIALVVVTSAVALARQGEPPPALSSPGADGAKQSGLPKPHRAAKSNAPQMSLFAPAPAPTTGEPADDKARQLVERLRAVDVNHLTPLQAMNALAALIDEARKV